MGVDIVILARFVLTGIALLLGFLAVVTWNRRKEAAAATVFAALLASMAVYCFGYAGEIAQTNVAEARHWLDVEYLALPWAGGLWVLAASRHNGQRVRSTLLFVIPAITFLGHYTNFHRLFYTAPMVLEQRGPFRVLKMERGPLSTLDNAYLLVCFVAGTWIYLSGLRNSSPIYRKQAVILVLSSVLPILGYFAYLANLSPWGLDTAPVTLGATCVMLYYGLFHCGIFDLSPVARDLIFNSMRDAVVIVDTHDRLLDFNPAAGALLPQLLKCPPGTSVMDALEAHPAVSEALAAEELLTEVTIERDHKVKNFELRAWPLVTGARPETARRVGKAVIFSDVSTQVQLREELRRRAETDSLTGIANRLRLRQALEIESLRFNRRRSPFSLLMIDLDHFKEVNDQFGHPAGDMVLKLVAERLLTSLRKTDLLARYGGEEFAVLLPETPEAGALVIGERIREAVFREPVEVDGFLISLTVSVGVSCHVADGPADPELLLKEADMALYRAKASGRNRVEVI